MPFYRFSYEQWLWPIPKCKIKQEHFRLVFAVILVLHTIETTNWKTVNILIGTQVFPVLIRWCQLPMAYFPKISLALIHKYFGSNIILPWLSFVLKIPVKFQTIKKID
jgi:hypothetical protein